MRRNLFILFCFLPFFCYGAGSLKGRVLINKNTGLDNTKVFIRELKTGVVSDSSGYFFFPDIPQGRYNVYFMRASYISKRIVKVYIEEDITTDLVITLDYDAHFAHSSQRENVAGQLITDEGINYLKKETSSPPQGKMKIERRTFSDEAESYDDNLDFTSFTAFCRKEGVTPPAKPLVISVTDSSMHPLAGCTAELFRNKSVLRSGETNYKGQYLLAIDDFKTLKEFKIRVKYEERSQEKVVSLQGDSFLLPLSVTKKDTCFTTLILEATTANAEFYRKIFQFLPDLQRKLAINGQHLIRVILYKDKWETFRVLDSGFMSSADSLAAFLRKQPFSGGGDRANDLHFAINTACGNLPAAGVHNFIFIAGGKAKNYGDGMSETKLAEWAVANGVCCNAIGTADADNELEMRLLCLETGGTYAKFPTAEAIIKQTGENFVSYLQKIIESIVIIK